MNLGGRISVEIYMGSRDSALGSPSASPSAGLGAGLEREHHSMALKLRLFGWTLFLAGLPLFHFVGPVAGLIVSGLGIFVTSTCNLMSSREHLKRTWDPPELLNSESAEKAKEVIRKRASRRDPEPQSSPPSPPSTQD